MSATNPAALHELWLKAINAGDLEGLLAIYEPGASVVTQPGQVVSGIPAIREALAGVLTLKPHATLEPQTVVQAGDLALVVSRWQLTGTGPDGDELTFAGQTADTVRQQADGSWLIVIDNPWGDQLLAP